MDISRAQCTGCGRPMAIVRTYCSSCDVAMEGNFEVSALARLSLEDQLFVIAFLRNHGSIKKMEQLFGISYPTVKNRLTSIGAHLDSSFEAPAPNSVILEQLAEGKIDVDDALERLS